MSRQLLILRHGKSDWNVNANDFNRPLKKRGERAANELGIWLQNNNLIPDYILCSPAERAKKTAEKLIQAMDASTQQIHYHPNLYSSELELIKSILATCPKSALRVLLVGHNPTLESLLIFLDNKNIPKPDNGKLLPTATLAAFKMPDDWQELKKNCARLLFIKYPSKIFKSYTGIIS